jgi:hypothetical protein
VSRIEISGHPEFSGKAAAKRSVGPFFYLQVSGPSLAEEVAVLEAAEESGERHQQSEQCGAVHGLTVPRR